MLDCVGNELNQGDLVAVFTRWDRQWIHTKEGSILSEVCGILVDYRNKPYVYFAGTMGDVTLIDLSESCPFLKIDSTDTRFLDYQAKLAETWKNSLNPVNMGME